ncbi:MAG: serine hydrolase domain-containing protein [Janthinobacterium lividum]
MDLDRLLLERRIDQVLAPWAGGAGPGLTVGLVQGGALVAHRSAGLANIEHGVPIGTQTRFRIASVSKQFTCAAILLLAHEGRVSLEDPARMHLPELPDQGITIAQLMHNTSGLRDMLEIQRQGGADLGVPVSAAALLEGICRQRSLNFIPGSRFLYSNSNFLLLGLIVERIEQAPLETVLERRIFGPLGMTMTRHTPDPLTVVPDLATGYVPRGEGWGRAAHAFALGGEGGLVSGVIDLALWQRSLASGRLGAGRLAPALARQTPFLNGTENRYARGQIVREYRGHRTVSHSGLWPGFKTEFLMVPALDVAVIAISNAGNSDPGLAAQQVLDAVLETAPGTLPPVPLPDAETLRGLAGRYLDPVATATLDIGLDASGAPTLTSNGLTVTAVALADGRLASPRSSSVLAVRRDDRGIEVEQDAGHVSHWRRVPDGALLPAGLAGTYRSPEMAATWTVDEGFVRSSGPVAAGGAWPIEAVEDDVFRVFVPGTLFRAWLDVRVVRAAGAVVALEVNGGRARRVRYDRVAG